MSSRRKRAAPVHVDEETQKKLDWNMHEHRKTELPFDTNESSLVTSLSEPPDSGLSIFGAGHSRLHENNKITANLEVTEILPQLSVNHQPDPLLNVTSETVDVCSFEEPGCSMQDSPEIIELLVIPVSTLVRWNALIGEFNLRLNIPMELADVTFCLQQTPNALLMISASTSSHQSTKFPVMCSFSGLSLEDLDWLQKRKIIQLCHLSEDGAVKVPVQK